MTSFLPFTVDHWPFGSITAYSKAENTLRGIKFAIDTGIYQQKEIQTCEKVFIDGLGSYSVSRLIKHDGNDQFRAISMLIAGSQSYHQEYREMVVSVPTDYRKLLGWTKANNKKVSESFIMMGRDNHPGSRSTLTLLAEIYGRNLIVLRDCPKKGPLIEQYHPSNRPEEKPAHLLYQYGDQFELLLDKYLFDHSWPSQPSQSSKSKELKESEEVLKSSEPSESEESEKSGQSSESEESSTPKFNSHTDEEDWSTPSPMTKGEHGAYYPRLECVLTVCFL